MDRIKLIIGKNFDDFHCSFAKMGKNTLKEEILLYVFKELHNDENKVKILILYLRKKKLTIHIIHKLLEHMINEYFKLLVIKNKVHR